MREPLTQKQRETLDVLHKSKKRSGMTPTQRELMTLLGVAQNAVRARLLMLARKGYILLLPNKARGIVLIGRGR